MTLRLPHALTRAGAGGLICLVSMLAIPAPAWPAVRHASADSAGTGSPARAKSRSKAARRKARAKPKAASAAATNSAAAAAASGAPAAAPAGAVTAADTALPSGKSGMLTDISVAQARRLFEGKAAIFVDARAPDQYAMGHIPGALSCYYMGFPPTFQAVEGLLPKDAPIVLYCASEECGLAEDLGRKMLPMGYTNLMHFRQGLTGWMMAQMRMDSGPPAH